MTKGEEMNRRDKSIQPEPGMIWSDKHQLWMDPDSRTPERKAQDECIALRAERDQLRAERDEAGRQVVKLREEFRIATLQRDELRKALKGMVTLAEIDGLTHNPHYAASVAALKELTK